MCDSVKSQMLMVIVVVCAELLVEGCGRADPLAEGECCVYGAGALRFLALEPRLGARAARAGALHLAALHLKILNTAVRAHFHRAMSVTLVLARMHGCHHF